MFLDDRRAMLTDPADLRKFGLLVGGILLLLSSFAVWRDRLWGYPVMGVAVLLMAAALAMPGTLRWFHWAWMALAVLLGTVMSTVILAVIFYLVISPMGLVMRVFSGDPMRRRYGPPELPSYWIKRKTPDTPRDFEKQF